MDNEMKQRELDIKSNDNTLFVTEQCNNRCIMCCQPPKKEDDIDILFAQNIERIKNAPKDLPIIGITGGEPTLLGNKLIELILLIREELPNTDIHILSNGRNFKDMSYAKRVVEAGDNKLILGIPLHSDYERDHDIIAGAKGAYNETMLGLYNIAMQGGCIELRVVMNSLNYQRFLPMAEFIHKNLSFVAWTAFMGMERTGYADKRSDKIWIEPIEYVSQLDDAVHFLDDWHHEVAIYNIPLCLLPKDLHPFARKSISDWRNYYPEICIGCKLKEECCGLFTTSSIKYKGIKLLNKN